MTLCLALGSPPGLWAADTKVSIVGSHDYSPFYFRDADGNLSGIFIDIWNLWAQKTGMAIEFQSMEFAQALDAVRNGQADIMAGFFYNEQRARIYDFSQPFYEIDTHIFFHENIYGVKRLKDLSGFKIGVVKGDYAQAYVKQRAFSVDLVAYANYEDLINAALNGDIKVFVCDTPVALFLLSKHDQSDRFKHAAEPLYSNKIYAGVKKGHTAILTQIKDGLAQITPGERRKIDSRWRVRRSGQKLPLRLLAGIGIGLLVLAALLALLNYQLRRRISAATSDLKQKQQRLESSESALQEMNEELEARVKRRTSELRNSNTLLQDQIALLVETESRLARQNAHLSALHETMLGLINRLDLEELLDAIITHAVEGAGAQHGYIYLLNPADNQLDLRVGRGFYSELIGYRLKIGEGLAGKVVEAQHHLLVDDYHNWRGRDPGVPWDNIGSIVGMPLNSGDQTVGVLGVCHLDSDQCFNQDEIDFLSGFAELASIALDNARLYADLQKELMERKLNEKLRRQLEERIQQTQKMEAIGTLAGGIAHDFNNILASILGYTELAKIETAGNEKLARFLDNAYKAGMRAKGLVQQILTFSRKGDQEEIPVLLPPIIKEAVKLLRASIPVTVEIRQHIEAQDAMVLADPVQIHQVLMNLSANAAHAMEEDGGVLDISLEKVVLDETFCKALPDLEPGRYAQLVVRDTGQGMGPEVLARSFEPYFTTKEMERGTGLGLSVVHGIVQRYGGHIMVESEPGQGACFTIYLPWCEAEEKTPIQGDGSVPRGNERLLFVDDEAELIDIGREVLVHLGYHVTICKNGQEALELFRQKPDAFDLVLTDMTMPQMTGDKLAEALLKIRPQLPIIVCTGFSHRLSSEKAEAIGIRKLIMKPFEISTLAETIRAALDETKA